MVRGVATDRGGTYSGVGESDTENSVGPTAPVIHGCGTGGSASVANQQPVLREGGRERMGGRGKGGRERGVDCVQKGGGREGGKGWRERGVDCVQKGRGKGGRGNLGYGKNRGWSGSSIV